VATTFVVTAGDLRATLVTALAGTGQSQGASGCFAARTPGIGIAGTVDGSFTLRKGDTIATVQAAYRKRWETSRERLASLRSDDIVDGRGARPVWALQLQVLRELAHHAGHADILREQILASRSPTTAANGSRQPDRRA
jgi:hypothetical protein